jgi:hypothetical protein
LFAECRPARRVIIQNFSFDIVKGSVYAHQIGTAVIVVLFGPLRFE